MSLWRYSSKNWTNPDSGGSQRVCSPGIGLSSRGNILWVSTFSTTTWSTNRQSTRCVKTPRYSWSLLHHWPNSQIGRSIDENFNGYTFSRIAFGHTFRVNTYLWNFPFRILQQRFYLHSIIVQKLQSHLSLWVWCRTCNEYGNESWLFIRE